MRPVYTEDSKRASGGAGAGDAGAGTGRSVGGHLLGGASEETHAHSKSSILLFMVCQRVGDIMPV